MNQSGFFEDRDEPGGRHQARARIVPPNQRLSAGHLAARKIHLGLVMEHELTFVERLAQPVFQRQLAGHHVRHLLCVKQIAFAARLGLVERGLGVLEQGVAVSTVVGEQGYSDLGGDMEHCVVQLEWMLQKSDHQLLKSPRHLAILLDLRQHHGKQVSTDACQQVGVAQLARQPLCHQP